MKSVKLFCELNSSSSLNNACRTLKKSLKLSSISDNSIKQQKNKNQI